MVSGGCFGIGRLSQSSAFLVVLCSCCCAFLPSPQRLLHPSPPWSDGSKPSASCVVFADEKRSTNVDEEGALTWMPRGFFCLPSLPSLLHAQWPSGCRCSTFVKSPVKRRREGGRNLGRFRRASRSSRFGSWARWTMREQIPSMSYGRLHKCRDRSVKKGITNHSTSESIIRQGIKSIPGDTLSQHVRGISSSCPVRSQTNAGR